MEGGVESHPSRVVGLALRRCYKSGCELGEMENTGNIAFQFEIEKMHQNVNM